MSILDLNLKNDELAVFRLRELYRKYGYTYYKMSKFEEYDLYVRNKNFLASDHILTFTDVDGKLMAMKPDVTLSIVKNARDGDGALQKVYYNENVYRTSPAFHGYREIMQAGLECIGSLDLYAMGEVVMLAARSLETISTEYILDLSHLGVVTGLLEEMGLAGDSRRELLGYVGEKNTSAIAAACRRLKTGQEQAELLCRLAMLYGTPQAVLPQLEEMILGGEAAGALAELKALCQLLAPYSLNLRLDFSLVSDMSYYSGLIFRGYLPGLASAVLSGGRYDNLLRKMGKSAGAIGFAVYLDLLERLDTQEPDYDVDVLLLYREDTDPAAVAQAAQALERAGRSVRAERTVPPGLKYRQLREVE